MIQLVEIVEAPTYANVKDRFHVREVFVSPEHIVMIREDRNIARVLSESNATIPGIDANMKYTKITINRGTTGQDIVVLGSSEMVYEKVYNSRSKQLLRG